jgi:hypothetical protein
MRLHGATSQKAVIVILTAVESEYVTDQVLTVMLDGSAAIIRQLLEVVLKELKVLLHV